MAVFPAGSKTCGTAAVVLSAALALTGCSQLRGLADPPATSVPPPTPPPTSTAPSAPEEPDKTSPTPSPTLESWPDVVAKTSSGVAHLQVASCEEGTSFGTGFLVDADLLVTAAHVIDEANSVTVRVGDELISAQILGASPNADIALLKLARDSQGYQFSLAEKAPRLSTEITVMGFPDSTEVKNAKISDSGFTTNKGTIAAKDQDITYRDGLAVNDLLRYDAASYAGISGGPLITQNARVVGLASGGRVGADGTPHQGWSYAVSGDRIAQAVKEWSARGSFVPMSECQSADTGDWPDLESKILSNHPQAANIAQSLVAHGQDINAGNYAAAYEVFTPAMQQRVGSMQHWSSGMLTSRWLTWQLDDVTSSGDTLDATVQFITAQTPEYGHDGQSCSLWNLKYTMAWNGIRWLMDDLKELAEPVDCTAELDGILDSSTEEDDIGD